jgi:membrane-associated protease RseP (regulator of RpoE activity)
MSEPTPAASYTFEVSSYPQVFIAASARHRRWWLHISLLLLTFATTLIVGARLEYNFTHNLPAFDADTFAFPLFHLGWIAHDPARVLLGLPFSLTLMGILLSHELGHFVVAERNGVYATLPYFIPAPTFIGTFGAVIRIKSPIRSRQALFDIGIAGPIAGFLVAVPALFWGLALSKPISPMATNSAVQFGYPLIFKIVHYLLAPFTPHAAALGTLCLHPVAVAAWVGMFATALNLLPGGQLDGGHITYAVSPRAHKWVTRAAIVVLLAMGWLWSGWVVWAGILGFTGMRHPNVPPWPDIGPKRRWMALLAVLMLALTLVMAPFPGMGLFGR